jgi:hypothetical protein
VSAKLRFWWDVAERTIMTFVGTFVGVYVVELLAAAPGGQNILEAVSDFSLLAKAAVPAAAATFTFVKSIIAAKFPRSLPLTASLLPASKDPAAPVR